MVIDGIFDDDLADSLFLNNEAFSVLQLAQEHAIARLRTFAKSADYLSQMELAFGEGVEVSQWQEAWLNGEVKFPEIEIRSRSELGNAWGAYARSTDKIYLAWELLEHQSVEEVTAVLLEEYGHFVDAQVNLIDALGDEGQIFSLFVNQKELTTSTFNKLREENDQASVFLDNQRVNLEQFQSPSYSFQIIAQGTDIEKGISINDRGKVAFVQNGDLFVGDGSGSVINFTDLSNGTVQPGVQINNQDQVIATTQFSFDTASVFLWNVSDSTKKNISALIAKSGIPRNYYDPTEYFKLLLSYPSANNIPFAANSSVTVNLNKNAVFAGLWQNDFSDFDAMLSTPFIDDEGNSVFNVTPIDSPVSPIISDTGKIVVRLGNRDQTNNSGPMSPIVLYDSTLTTNSKVNIAGVFNGFQALGRSSGISEDGQIVVFYGELASQDLLETPPMNEKEQLDLLNQKQANIWYKNGGKLQLDELESGAGIFASIAVKDAFWDKNNNQIFDTGDEEVSRVLVRIAGLDDGFTSFEQNSAVRVNSTHRSEEYTDSNKNGIWDFGEPYTDSNQNGVFDLSQQAVEIIYLANNLNNDKGIYENTLFFLPQNVGRFDPDRPASFAVSDFSFIIGKDTVLPQWGGVTIPTLGNSIKDVDIHDSINQRGDIAFWVENGYGEQAVIRGSQQVVKFDQAVYRFDENETQTKIKLTREGDLQEPLSLFVNFVDIIGISEGGEIGIDLLVNISSIFLSKLSIPLKIANKAISSASAEMEDFVDGFSSFPVFFAANQSTAEIEIIIQNDTKYEGDQAVTLSLGYNNFTNNPLFSSNLGTNALLVIEDDESLVDGLKNLVPSNQKSLVDTLLGGVLFSLNVTKKGIKQDNTKTILPLSWKDTLKQVSQLYVKELGKNVIENAVISIVGSVIQHRILAVLEDYYEYQKEIESKAPTFYSTNSQLITNSLNFAPASIQSEESGILSDFESSSITPIKINELGQIIGLYDSEENPTGILVQPDNQVIYLRGNSNESVIPININNSGQIVGYMNTADDLPLAIIWQDNTVTDLASELGEVASEATAINDSGQVIINSENANGALNAFLWSNGQLTEINYGNQNDYVIDINNSGQIIGYLETLGSTFGLEGFVWQNGSITKLGSLGGNITIPMAINEQGKIMGISTTAEGELQSFIWENGQINPLVSFDIEASVPLDLNDSGQVIGIYDQISSSDINVTESHAFLWDNGNITELGTLGGDATLPLSINNSGQIVGISDINETESDPFIWQQGGFIDLDEVLSIDNNSELVGIFEINNSGQILGAILDQENNVNFSVNTIEDDQMLPQLSINNLDFEEGNSGERNLSFTVTLSSAADEIVTVDYATADGTATAFQDYAPRIVNETLVFNPGEVEKTITLQVLGDTEVESNETFFVDLTNPTNALISDGRGVATIKNDDKEEASAWKIVNLTNNAATNTNSSSYYPKIDGDYILWKNVDEETLSDDLILFDGNSIQTLVSGVYLGTYDLFGDQVVWTQYTDQDPDYEVYFYDGNQTIRLTDNDLEDYEPLVSELGVVWHERDVEANTDAELYFFDGTTIQNLTDNDIDYNFGVQISDTQISGDWVVWSNRIFNEDYPVGAPSSRPPADDYDIFLFDGNNVINLSEAYGTDTLPGTGDSIIWRDWNPQISDDKIYWASSGYDLDGRERVGTASYLFDGQSVTQLNEVEDIRAVSEAGIVWFGDSSGGDSGIAYFHNGDTVEPINDSGYVYDVKISEDQLVLTYAPQGWGSDYGIYTYKNGELVELFYPNSGSYGFDPEISESNIAWWGYENSSSGIADIFLASPRVILTDRAVVFGSLNDDVVEVGNPSNFDGADDLLFTGSGHDRVTMTETSHDCRIYGGTGDDQLFANERDRLFGGSGNDTLDASQGTGDNRLYGGAGDDDFFLGSNDRLIGGKGDDRFFTGTGGDNVITGGTGADEFWIAIAEIPNSTNTITDLTLGEDVIGFGGFPELTFADLTLTPNGANTIISLGADPPLAELQGIETNSLSESDFTFVAQVPV